MLCIPAWCRRCHWKGKKKYAGPVIGLISVTIFTINGNILQYIQRQPPPHIGPLFSLWLCHVIGILLFPFFLRTPPFSAKEFGWALFFAALLCFYNIFWVLSSIHLPVSVTNGIYQTCIGFAYLLTLLIGHARPEKLKFFSVFICILGGFLDATGSYTRLGGLGISFAFIAAISSAIYQVAFTIVFPGRGIYFTAYFSYLISLAHIMFLPILFLLMHPGPYQIERFVWPHEIPRQLLILLTAILAFAVNCMFLVVLALSGPVMMSATMAMSLPIGVLGDCILHGIKPSAIQMCGNILIMCAFAIFVRGQWREENTGKWAPDKEGDDRRAVIEARYIGCFSGLSDTTDPLVPSPLL